MKDDSEAALAYLDANVSVHGVATIQVRDGQLFMFSRALVEDLLQRIEKSKQDRIVVFVKRGPELTEKNLA